MPGVRMNAAGEQETIPEWEAEEMIAKANTRAIQVVPDSDGQSLVNLSAETPIWLRDESRECLAGDLDLSEYEVVGSFSRAGRVGQFPSLAKRQGSARSETGASAAARLVRARRGALSRGEERFERYETSGGEVFYIKRLNWPQVTRVHLESGLGLGVLDLEEGAEGLAAFTASSLEACVYGAPEEGAKYFTQVTAQGWAVSEDEELAPLVGELSNACLHYNRLLLPKSYRTRPAATAPETSESPQLPDEKPHSLSSTSTSTPTGSTATDSSEPPATSPTSSAAPNFSAPTEEASLTP